MEEIKKSELFWAASTSVEAYEPAMKALSVIADKFGIDEVYGRIAVGDISQIAAWIRQCDGYSGPDSDSELERELLGSGALNIEATRYERRYRLLDIDGETQYQRIDGDGGRVLRTEARDAIKQAVAKFPTTVHCETVLKSIYRMAIDTFRDADCDSMFGICKDAPKPQEPEPEQEAPQAEPTVIREKVVVMEKEPVLETMLREAMMKTLVDMNLDSIQEQIKERLVNEFGFKPVRHVVKMAKVETEVDEVVHHEFDTVLHWVANDTPIYMYGGAGSGKNVLAEQVAKALNLDFYFMNSVTDEFKISGFIDAYGVYHETEFYKAFKNGGLFFLDELDASAPEVLVCLNAAIANRYFSFPTGRVEAHKDFRVIAAGNTLGTGADASYTGRMQLDAASLNRFVVVEIDYDPAIDLLCAGGDTELVEFIELFRKVTKSCGLPVVASYRNITQIRVAMEKLNVKKALLQCLCKEMNQDDINIVAERMSSMRGANKYYDGFRNVKSIIG